ncbi:MAG TPA: heme-binding domain-containing protein [Prolixibacteraceae bacterium]|nr:heme-binding domain-containing protein [Prolixibacteraceae bacterium]
MKKFRIAGLILAGIFIVLQFFQPELNRSGLGDNSILAKEKLPEPVAAMLKHSCFDCHSNQTNYPWYDRIAPASWLVAHHVKEGKKQLNFSDWGSKDVIDKITELGKIGDEVKSGNMPIPSYVMIHRDAKLSKEQTEELIAWTVKFSEELLAKEE